MEMRERAAVPGPGSPILPSPPPPAPATRKSRTRSSGWASSRQAVGTSPCPSGGCEAGSRSKAGRSWSIRRSPRRRPGDRRGRRPNRDRGHARAAPGSRLVGTRRNGRHRRCGAAVLNATFILCLPLYPARPARTSGAAMLPYRLRPSRQLPRAFRGGSRARSGRSAGRPGPCSGPEWRYNWLRSRAEEGSEFKNHVRRRSISRLRQNLGKPGFFSKVPIAATFRARRRPTRSSSRTSRRVADARTRRPAFSSSAG
jgi:hypothetical protein